MGRKIHDSLTFDDVLLKPSSSSTLPKNVITKTLLTKSVSLEIPIISAAGGIATTWKNGDAKYGGSVLISANKVIHQKMLKLLKPALK